VAPGAVSASAAAATGEQLTAEALLGELPRLDRWLRLRPDYDRGFLDWLLPELEAMTDRGRLVRRLVRSGDGAPAGWYLYYLRPGDLSQVLQVAAAPANAGLVLDELFAHARAEGAAALAGRLEPHLSTPLRARRCLFRPSEWALIHTDNTGVLSAIGFGEALLTRLDGEWWMGHHLPGLAARPRVTPAAA
jgi:hypothetical protein